MYFHIGGRKNIPSWWCHDTVNYPGKVSQKTNELSLKAHVDGTHTTGSAKSVGANAREADTDSVSAECALRNPGGQSSHFTAAGRNSSLHARGDASRGNMLTAAARWCPNVNPVSAPALFPLPGKSWRRITSSLSLLFTLMPFLQVRRVRANKYKDFYTMNPGVSVFSSDLNTINTCR